MAMNFSEALELVKEGEKVTRAGWNGTNMFIFLVPGSIFKVNREPLLSIYPEGTEITYHAHIDQRTSTGIISPWVPQQMDMLSVDWHQYKP